MKISFYLNILLPFRFAGRPRLKLKLLLFYQYNLLINTNLRSFVKILFDIKHFTDFLSLTRMEKYRLLFDAIHWPATWSLTTFSLYAFVRRSDFANDRLTSFRQKLFFKELLTMDVLHRRLTDLYLSEWNCF